ncbi:hypothetical protein [Acrocarpospora pleiomorpha]|uniref:hypothetical protein n=1 Tax=Acrocarpospora pleiomorpha TaxID=90975 RepID=UPI001FE3956A|nr:hypothetical protein [Acrocarpospora pleiomorpha]
MIVLAGDVGDGQGAHDMGRVDLAIDVVLGEAPAFAAVVLEAGVGGAVETPGADAGESVADVDECGEAVFDRVLGFGEGELFFEAQIVRLRLYGRRGRTVREKSEDLAVARAVSAPAGQRLAAEFAEPREQIGARIEVDLETA